MTTLVGTEREEDFSLFQLQSSLSAAGRLLLSCQGSLDTEVLFALVALGLLYVQILHQHSCIGKEK